MLIANPANAHLKINDAGLSVIKDAEKLRLVAYDDGYGNWTIGWGHVRGVKKGDTCTQAEAQAWLEEDVAGAEAVVKRYVKVALNENEFSALVSFVFNVGSVKFFGSTLLRLLNAGRRSDAADELPKWIYATKGNRKIEAGGLIVRRGAERALMLKPVMEPSE